MAYSKKDYENEPVHYCVTCLSLNIKEIPNVKGLDACGECGNTDIETTDMDHWNVLYTVKYGQAFLTDELEELED